MDKIFKFRIYNTTDATSFYCVKGFLMNEELG